jgi:hypothetical protein
MAFNSKQINNPTPAGVVKFVAAATFLLQALPAIIMASTFVPQDIKDIVNLTCDITNIFISAVAIFFGTNSHRNP